MYFYSNHFISVIITYSSSFTPTAESLVCSQFFTIKKKARKDNPQNGRKQ